MGYICKGIACAKGWGRVARVGCGRKAKGHTAPRVQRGCGLVAKALCLYGLIKALYGDFTAMQKDGI